MQREDVLGEALKLLELQGIANTTLEMVAERVDYPLDELRRFWPDKEAILYDALRYLSQQIDVWRRQLMLCRWQSKSRPTWTKRKPPNKSCWHVIRRYRSALKTTAIRAVYLSLPVRFIPILATLFINWPISKKARPTISPTNC